jgi:UPF0271 protein
MPFCFVQFSRRMRYVDLNADVGESFGPHIVGDDAALIPLITSASVAAGFHSGDPSVLRATIRLARQHGVAIGAHPSFPDLQGFGRRMMHVGAQELADIVLYQVAAVAGVAAAEGVRLQHVKAHGALYNAAARDAATARSVCDGVYSFDRSLIIVGPPGSALAAEAAALGLPVATEAFADRAYCADGTLVPRDAPGAVLTDPQAVAARVVRMIRDGRVTAVDGSELSIAVDTVCVHGDTPEAPAIARRVRDALRDAGVTVQCLRPPHV